MRKKYAILFVCFSIFLISLFSYTIGFNNKLDYCVTLFINDKIQNYEQRISKVNNSIGELETEEDILSATVAEKKEIDKAMQDYIKSKNEYISDINNLNSSVNSLTNEIQAARDSLNAKKAASKQIPEAKNHNTYYYNGSKKERYVWVGKTGNRYHNKSCHTLKGNKYQIPISEATAKGRTPCSICGG